MLPAICGRDATIGMMEVVMELPVIFLPFKVILGAMNSSKIERGRKRQKESLKEDRIESLQ